MSTNRAPLRTPLALAVLNLLSERPMHPYEMRARMQQRGHDQIIRQKGGSIYDTVERLQKAGLVEALETSREGHRPERTVYSVTESGRDELGEWMRDLLARPVPEYPQFAAALAFLGGLDRADAVKQLRRRVTALDAEIAASDVQMRALQEYGLPRLFTVEGEYARAMHQAEADWIRGILKDIAETDLWPDHDQLVALANEYQMRVGGGA